MTVKAITPNDIPSAKLTTIPEFVLEAFNELVAAHFSEGEADFTQEDVVERILSKVPSNGTSGSRLSRGDIFDRGWLNVEEIYEEAGWDVEYEKPIGYAGESFAAHFTFTPKR